MKLLVLGGTKFLGRHIVNAALARNYEVTLFNRGLENADLFPDIEKLRGDRDGDLKALKGPRWDAVIDTCGYAPRHVRDSAALLADAVDHYTFISTISVYTDFSKIGIDETAPVAAVAGDKEEEVIAENYGGLKALCEKTAENCMPGRTLSIRAGLIVGPYDPIERFTYWVRRVERGGEVLGPGEPDRQLQLIDARDLAEWILRMSESRQAGIYNATGPDYRLTTGKLLQECCAVSANGAQIIWVGDQFLTARGVGAWDELPLWLPEDHVKFAGFMAIDCQKAFDAGLTFRPLAETVRDTLEWRLTCSKEPGPYRVFGIEVHASGLTEERESELLRAWKEHGLKEARNVQGN